MSIVDELVAVFTYKYEGKADAAQFQRDLDTTAKKAQAAAAAVTTRLADFGDGITKVMSRAVLGFAAITGAGGAALGKGVIEASAQWEGFEAALTTIEGSSEKAKQSLDWISGFAKRTPYDLAGVVESFTKLRSYGLDAADGTLETLGNAASAMNKPLNSAVEMFADAASFQFERMREFGIVASQKGEEVTFQFQKDGKTVRETVKKTGSAVTSWIKNNLEGRFAGAMIRQSKTWDGLMSNLGDSWEDFKRRIGAGGFFDTVKGKLGDLLEYIATLDADGTLDRWSKNLSWAFEGVSNGVVEMARQLKGNVETIGQLWEQGGWSEKLKPFAAALGVLAAALFPVTTMLAVGALAINDWLTYMAGGDSVIGGFIDRLSELLGAKPEEVARVLGELAKGGAWFAVAAGGIALFASAIRKLSGALVLLKVAASAVKMLGRLAGIKWADAASGAAGAAEEALSQGKGSRGRPGKTPGIGAGRAATTGFSVAATIDTLANATPEEAAARGKALNEWADANVPTPSSLFKSLSGPGSPQRASAGPSHAEAERDSMSSLREQFGSLMDRFGSFMAGIKGSDVIDAAGIVSTMRGMQSMTQSVAAPANMSAVVNDSRSFPVTNNISAPVSVSVTQAVQAPAAVGRAIATAVGKSAVMPRAAVTASPAS